MATHTYTARVIYENNKFPTTHEPTVPIPHFGFAPYGMSVIIAMHSLLDSKEVFSSALLTTSLIYPFFSISFILLLSLFFSPLPVIFTIFSTLFFEHNIVDYIGWGGNQTILSIAFVTCAVSWITLSFRERKLTLLSSLVTSIFLAASIYTHVTPVATFAFFLTPLFIYLITKRNFFSLKFSITTILFLTFLLVPLFTSILPLPAATLLTVKQHAQYFAISAEWGKTLPTTIDFLIKQLGVNFLLISIIGIFLAFALKDFFALLFSIFILSAIILIMNSAFMILPLSSMFYPDRVATTMAVACSYFFCYTIESISKIFLKAFKVNNIFSKIVITIALFFAFYYWQEQVFLRYSTILFISADKAAVTENDLEAFAWIEKTTTSAKDAIVNNYGDAGLWIPAIINRKITQNDYNMHYKYLIEEGQKKLKPTYVYIGQKAVYYPLSMSNEEMKKYPLLRIVHQIGNATVYKSFYPE